MGYCRIYNLSEHSNLAIRLYIFNSRSNWKIWPKEEIKKIKIMNNVRTTLAIANTASTRLR